MDLLSLPLLEALVVIAKLTFLIFWAVIMLGFAIRLILSSIKDGLKK